jgi:membrane protein YqaA with SNARE-associated domain
MHKLVLWVQRVLVPMLGAPGMCLVAFLDSSFLSFPEVNDILLITSSHLHPERAWLYAAMTTLGSVVGCHVMWVVGRRGGEAFLARKFGQARVDKTREALRRWGVFTIAIPSVLPPPMPFKIFVIAAGVFEFSPRKMAITLAISRGLRFTFWALMGAWYGDAALTWLERFDGWFAAHWASVVMIVGLLVVAVLIAHWSRRLRARPGPDAGGA